MLSPLAASIYGAIGFAGATGLGVGGFAYASRWPTSQIFGRTLTAPRSPGQLALTFDDGPNPAWTPRLLDILAQHNVRATFFMVGKFAKAEPELARRVADAGHLIGNHTWSHPDLSAHAELPNVLDELTRTSDLLADIIGKPIRLLPPALRSTPPLRPQTRPPARPHSGHVERDDDGLERTLRRKNHSRLNRENRQQPAPRIRQQHRPARRQPPRSQC